MELKHKRHRNLSAAKLTEHAQLHVKTA